LIKLIIFYLFKKKSEAYLVGWSLSGEGRSAEQAVFCSAEQASMLCARFAQRSGFMIQDSGFKIQDSRLVGSGRLQ